MPFYLVKDPGPFGGRAEVAREVYKSRADAQNGLRLHRGRWRIVNAASALEAEKLAAQGQPRERALV